MIRHADKDMLPQLIKLWEVCFGDGEEYSSFFFSRKMIGTDYFENQFVSIEDEKVVSMLSVLSAKIRQKDGLKPFWYIYGVATAPEYRSRGYARRLVNHVFALAKQKNVVVGLVPASESLYGYYGKLGFRTYFYNRRIEKNVEEVERYADFRVDYEIEPIQTDEYHFLRNESFVEEGTVIWDLDAVDYALAENRELGGEAVKILYHQKEYFMLFYCYEGVLYIRETNLSYEISLSVANELAKTKFCKKICISTCIQNGTGIQNVVTHGMIYNGDELRERGYLGLALD